MGRVFEPSAGFTFNIFCQILYLHFGGKVCKFWNNILELSHPCKYLTAKSESAKTFLFIFERHSLTNMVYITTTTATTTIEAHFGNPVTGKHTYRINIDWFYTPVKYPVWQKSYVSLEYISYTLIEVRHSWIFIIVVNVTVYHGNYPTPWQDLGGTNKQPCTSSVNRMKDNSLHFEGMGGGGALYTFSNFFLLHWTLLCPTFWLYMYPYQLADHFKTRGYILLTDWKYTY